MSCFLTPSLPPVCVFNPCTHKLSCRTRAPPSLSGSWRRESLLRILALLHHNTHDVSTFHTHFPNNYYNLLGMHGTKLCTGPREPTPRCPHTAPTCSQLAPQTAFRCLLCHLI